MRAFRHHGFTLLEIAVVAAVVSLLAALLWPVATASIDRSRSAACIANLRSLGAAMNLYLSDHEMRMPDMPAGRRSLSEPGPSIDTELAPYLDSRAALACPADPSLARETGTSYFYNSALRGQPVASLNFLGVADARFRIPVLVDKEGWHRGGESRVNHLFADGSASAQLRLFAE